MRLNLTAVAIFSVAVATLSGCSNPLNKHTDRDSVDQMVTASYKANKLAHVLQEDGEQAYPECMKRSEHNTTPVALYKKKCKKLYSEMAKILNKSDDFSGVSAKDLSDKKFYAKIKEQYFGLAYTFVS